MTHIQKLLKRLFPYKIITHRLSDLIHHLSNQQNENTKTYISIEKDNTSREFCYFTLEELIILYQQCPAFERSLYEILIPTNQVKVYVDFEYYTDNNVDIKNAHIGPICFLKILYHLFNSEQTVNFKTTNYFDLVMQQFLVLDASTSDKISYHFIHANPSLLFENNTTLGLFMKVLIHYLLWETVQHKCKSFDVNTTLKKCTIADLITLLIPHINILRTQCIECHLLSTLLSVAEIANLLVLNKRNEFTLAIDLNVYSKNQQFRLFDCVKRGKKNSLLQSTSFPFQGASEMSYFDLLQKSIVTNTETINVPIVYLHNNQFLYKLNNAHDLSKSFDYHLHNISQLNTHLKIFFTSNTNRTSISDFNQSQNTPIITHTNIDQSGNQTQDFTQFVNKLIKSDTLHQGHIRSCVRGTHNKDILFFNIGGAYRFCPRIGTHHERNATAILIDTKNLTFCIRCKDPDCNNQSLHWKIIQ